MTRMRHHYDQWWCNALHSGDTPKGISLIARFMGPTWGSSGADRTQVGPMLAPWTLLFGMSSYDEITLPFPNFNGCTVEVCEWKSNSILHFTNWRQVINIIFEACRNGEMSPTILLNTFSWQKEKNTCILIRELLKFVYQVPIYDKPSLCAE